MRTDLGFVRRLGLSGLHRLTDEQMARLEPYYPKSHSTLRTDDRRVLNGIIINCNGPTPLQASTPHRNHVRRQKNWRCVATRYD
jgi:hypothetical protein